MSNVRELFGRAYQILSDRQRWEDKQRLYYKMRHDGLRRRNKPFPNAADLHEALIDKAITKQKPFWLAQAIGSDHLATFVSTRRQLADTTRSAADFFDFEIKNHTNFLRKLETAVDTMLLRGRGVMKAYVDPYDDYRVVFEALDPYFVLMDDLADSFEDCDEFVHVRHVSVSKFKRDRRYLQSAVDQVDQLRGGADAGKRMQDNIRQLAGQRDTNFEQYFADKELREGLTHSPKSDTVVIWEHYVKTMGGWTVYSYAPIAITIEVRKPYGVPYKVAGQVSLPFFSFQAEVKDEGWYSPRGLAEKVAPDELFACKIWNEWADAITYFNRPLLTSATPIQNPANYRWAPGEYVPGDLRGVQMGQPSMSFAEQMSFVRSEAEEKTQSPDFGITRQGAGGKSDKRTAKEIGYIQGVQGTGTNHNGQIFRSDLCKLYKHVWGLMLQYKRKSLAYFVADDLKELPEDALHGDYLIIPGGSTDDWDKSMRLQKAVQRLETFRGAPNINQDELAADVMRADDARLVSRLLIPQQEKAASEAEDEAQEITSMLVTHFPAPVKPGEDHLTRVKLVLQFLEAHGMKGKPVDPLAQQRIHQHLAAHMQFLKKLQPQAYKQVVQLIKKLESTPMAARSQAGAPGQAPQTAGTATSSMPQRRPTPAGAGGAEMAMV